MSTAPATLVSAKKRPTGRSPHFPAALIWLRRALKGVEFVSPGMAAEFARRLFFRPVRTKVRADEREVLARGTPVPFEVQGEKVAAWSWGTGPTVLLCHGWGGNAGQMTALVEPLVAKGFRVVALDLPGHGQSSGGLSSVVHFARTIRAAESRFGGLTAVVAHSLGAAAVVLARAQGLVVPKVVFFAAPMDFDLFWTRFREAFALSTDVWDRMRVRSERWLGMTFSQVLPQTHVAQLDGELLIFHDEADREVPVSAGEAMSKAWKGAVLVRTRGLGHNRILKDPQVVQQAASFIAAQSPAAAAQG